MSVFVAPFIMAPIIIFLVIVVPLWLVLHYRSKQKLNIGLSDNERHTLEQLRERARMLQERVETLESLLDEEMKQSRSQ
ncbi:envelope stress response membrane protein PspB [Alginatibacterium sediminis]|uniref:Envelope stress response membrane protein PspB n=1 Tax=Alginatibacterium sediminis TaxID=2164068 RepID=A0A420EGN1_9ALTE|nr:envelope stress response membrane protein PspB [Alginatibacterium sediminis]RKF19820.1 envelope stress response membrane protein PspB [Alginatibacterium sediminis]